MILVATTRAGTPDLLEEQREFELSIAREMVARLIYDRRYVSQSSDMAFENVSRTEFVLLSRGLRYVLTSDGGSDYFELLDTVISHALRHPGRCLFDETSGFTPASLAALAAILP